MPLGMVKGQPATQGMNTRTFKMSQNTLYEQRVYMALSLNYLMKIHHSFPIELN